MMEIHPLFDTDEQVWVFEETGVTARSLRELQQKYPSAKIVGYAPQGCEIRHDSSTPRTSHSVPMPRVGRPPEPFREEKKSALPPIVRKSPPIVVLQSVPLTKVVITSRPDRSGLREKALVFRSQAKNTAEIAVRLRCSEKTVRELIQEGRDVGDVRALVVPKRAFTPPTVVDKPRSWTKEEHELLVRYAGESLSSSQIATRLKRPRNSVMSRCHRFGIKLHGALGRGRPVCKW
jgi:hypothetical protein